MIDIDVTRRDRPTRNPLSHAAACALLFVGCAAGLSFGQRGLPPATSPLSQQLETVDEGVADRGPNAISLRRIEFDLRQDTGFDHLYEAPGRPDLMMRRDGAITAVFPQSFYTVSKGGMIPVIPPGTLFLIGNPSENDPAFPPPVGLPERQAPDVVGRDARQNSIPVSAPIDARVSSGTYSPAQHQPAPDDTTTLVDMAAEQARKQRLREIAARIGPH